MDDLIRRFPLVGLGFLLAVLWFDLMFDVQVFGEPPGVLREDVLVSISDYYQRVTVDASPMGRAVGGTMLLTLLAIGRQFHARLVERRFAVASLALAGPPIGLAMGRIVPNAIRLGGRGDSLDVQSALARSIAWEHVACFVAIAIVTAVQLVAVRAGEPAAPAAGVFETKKGGEA